MKKKLTAKQQLFCKHYLANGFNATQAAISAGYSEKTAYTTGSEYLGKPRVREYIDKHLEKVEKKLDMTIEWKLEKLKSCIDLAMVDSEEGKVLVNHNALLGAISESNKMQGHYAPEKSINANVTVDPDTEESRNLIKQFQRAY